MTKDIGITGTKLFDMASENEWITTYDWSRYASFNAIMGTNELVSMIILKQERKLRINSVISSYCMTQIIGSYILYLYHEKYTINTL